MGVLKDNRKYQAMTVADADELLLRIARVKAVIDKETASHKQKLAELELAHKQKLAAHLAEKKRLEEELCAYIVANPERFEKPRKRPVGQVGTYGIVTDPAYVIIKDKDAVVQFALENGYDDLIRTEHTPDKDAVLRRIMAGETVPGAVVIPAGDVAKLAFKKGYAEHLEEA